MAARYKCEICGLTTLGKHFTAANSNNPNGDNNAKGLIDKIKKLSLPLKNKDSYFICFNCLDIMEELFTKFMSSNKDKNKKENTLPKLNEQNYHSSGEVENLPIHRLALSKFCRICKSTRFDHVRNLDCYDKNSKLILKVCKLMSADSFEDEDANRYPNYLCHKCFLLFSKNSKNLFTSQPASKIICASFPSHKENCSLCAVLTEKDLAVFEVKPWDAKSSQWMHYKNLKKLCRICGCSNGKRHVSKTTDLLQNCIITLYNHSFENEDPNIYPFYVCNLCANKLNTFRYQKECNLQVTITPLSIFKPHSENCDICSLQLNSTEKYKKENTSFNEEPESKNRNTALYFHSQKLLRYCRICGLPNVRFYGNKPGKLKINEDVIKVINYSIINSLDDIQNDDPYLYPPALCNLCFTKLNINYNLKLNGRSSLIKWHVTFQAHKENCTVCSTSKYGLGIPEVVLNSDMKLYLKKLEFQSYSTSFLSVDDVLLKTTLERDAGNNVVTYGMPADQLRSHIKDELLSCSGCAVIPAIPIVAKCKHIICLHCIKSVFELEHACPNENCGQYITPDVVWTSKSMCDYINSSIFACKNSNICNFTGIMKVVIEHQLSCKFTKLILTENNSNNLKVHSSQSVSELTKDKKCFQVQFPLSNESKPQGSNNINDDFIEKPFKQVMDFIDDICDKNFIKKDDVISFLSKKRQTAICKEVGVQSHHEEENKIEDICLLTKLNEETPKKRKLSVLHEVDYNKEIASNVSCIPSVSKKFLPNVWDISSRECQLNLLNGSNSSNVSSTNDFVPSNEVEESLSLISSHSEYSDPSPSKELIIDTTQNIQVCPAQLNEYGKFNISSKCSEPVKSDSSVIEWNFNYATENAGAPQYLHVSPNDDETHNDDLLSESSSDQDLSGEEGSDIENI